MHPDVAAAVSGAAAKRTAEAAESVVLFPPSVLVIAAPPGCLTSAEVLGSVTVTDTLLKDRYGQI